MLRLDNLFDRTYVGSVIVNDSNGKFYEPGPGFSAYAGAERTLQLLIVPGIPIAAAFAPLRGPSLALAADQALRHGRGIGHGCCCGAQAFARIGALESTPCLGDRRPGARRSRAGSRAPAAAP